MKQYLHTVACPIDLVQDNPVRNLDTIICLLHGLPQDTDLVIFPELCTTGLGRDTYLLTEELPDFNTRFLSHLQQSADTQGYAIAGSYLHLHESGKFHNRGFVITPHAEMVTYDKRHLFGNTEKRIMSAGQSTSPIVEVNGWRIKLSICYDLRFPVWNRAVANDYDLLVVPASWPLTRQYAWEHLLIARAIENQCYVIGCNRTGVDGLGNYDLKQTMAVDPTGKILDLSGMPRTVTLSAEELVTYRERFQPWRDADKFTLDFR